MQEAALKLTPQKIHSYFTQITELANLYRYWFEVGHARSVRPRFIAFNENLLTNLTIIQHRLRQHNFEFGPYQFFRIREKKMRSIANAPLKDRVVHWLLYEHLKLHWLRRFICDSYGNIPGRGIHAAIKRLSSWTRKPELNYALQVDIAKYFASINHDYLKRILLAQEGDQNIRQLLINVVESYQTNEEFDFLFKEDTPYRKTIEKGMPLGNLTSQFFANIYLNEFDHWVKEELKIKYYIRYVDDMIFLGKTPAELKIIKEHITSKLLEIGLTINPKKIAIRKIENGIPFLGYITWKNHVSVGAYARNKFAKLLRHNQGKNIKRSIDSYRGIFMHTGASR